MSSNVINLGDLSIRRREKRLQYRDDRCRHKNTTWDANGDIITCDDCKMQISAVWMLHMLVDAYDAAMASITAREKSLADDKARNIHLIAARKVEDAWRSKTMVPCCLHCGNGVLPEDGFGGARMSRAIEIARRKANPGNRPGQPVPEK